MEHSFSRIYFRIFNFDFAAQAGDEARYITFDAAPRVRSFCLNHDARGPTKSVLVPAVWDNLIDRYVRVRMQLDADLRVWSKVGVDGVRLFPHF